MGDRGAGLGEPADLARRQVDRVGEDRPRPEPAGLVVDVEVVDRVREEPGDLADPSRSSATWVCQ